MRRRAAVAAGSVSVVGLLLLGGLFGGDPHSATPESPPSARGDTTRRALVRRTLGITAAEAPEASPEAPPGPHVRLAEALDPVAIRCWVGTEWEGLTLEKTRTRQAIEGGWYSDTVTELSGAHLVRATERHLDLSRFPSRLFRTDRTSLFRVSWEAERLGEEVACTVHPVELAAIDVQVVDEDGRPLPESRVYLGANGTTDPQGWTTIEGLAAGIEHSAFILGSEPLSVPRQVTVGPLEPDTHTAIRVTLEHVEAVDELAHRFGEEDPDGIFAAIEASEERERQEEQVLLAMAAGPLDPPTRQVVDDMLRGPPPALLLLKRLLGVP